MNRGRVYLGQGGLWWLVAALLVAGPSCSAGRTEASGHGIRTPLDHLADPGARAPQPATISRQNEPLGELVQPTEYEPLLYGAAFTAVRTALEDDQPTVALKAFQKYLETPSVRSPRSPELTFQLGRLSLLAGDSRGAEQAYAACASEIWALRDYCRYFEGRAALALGANQRAVAAFGRVPMNAPPELAVAARRLRGQAAFLANDDVTAIQELRADLLAQPRAAGWTQRALLLARALTRSPAAAAPQSTVVPILPTPNRAPIVEALTLLRRVTTEAAGTTMAKEAAALEKTALASLPREVGQALRVPSRPQQLAELTSLVDSRKFDEALKVAEKLLGALPEAERFSDLACEASIAQGKALAGKDEWGAAVDALAPAVEHCAAPDALARLLFLSGKYAVADRRFSYAVRMYSELERRVPSSSLADDARIRQADAYLELGDEAEFTRLLATILEDFPLGDLALDGAFRLAIRRIQKLDWAGAANVLERALPKARTADESRDQEYAGRERYFLARAWVETGEAARGLAEYEALIRDLPFSFYMQLALSRLTALDAGRAAAVQQGALAAAQAVPSEPQPQVRVHAPAFERALALLKQGEASWAEIELNSLPSNEQRAGVSASWLRAQLFSATGEQRLAHQQVRARSKDWLARWPVGEWRQVWELAFPRPHHRVVAREAIRNELPESLIYAVMREESGFDPSAASPAQAFGLMQLIRPTAKRFAKELGLRYSDRALLKPAFNIALGSRALRTFQDAFPTNPILAIPGYNAGPGRPRRWLKETVTRDFDVWVESIPFAETRRYTKRVLSSWGSYEFLYTPASSWMLPVHLNLPEQPEARL